MVENFTWGKDIKSILGLSSQADEGYGYNIVADFVIINKK